MEKNGYYYGVDASYPVLKNIRIGTVLTREVLSRDDALIQRLSAQNMYGVSMGEKERATALRLYADFGAVRIGGYRNNLFNRFPWVSGIQPVAGERAYTGRGNDKWGVVILATIE